MRLLIFVVFVCPLMACAEDMKDPNAEFMETVSSEFLVGMSWSNIKSTLTDLGARHRQLYNECLGEFEEVVTPCPEGYSLVTTIDLPREHSEHGKGEAQMYFVFDMDKSLASFFFEIYYEALHR